MKKHNEDIKEIAFKYFCKGLNSKEIGKLLDISYRTIQSWMLANKWKLKIKATSIDEKILQLKKKGYSYSQISKLLLISKTTIYKSLKNK